MDADNQRRIVKALESIDRTLKVMCSQVGDSPVDCLVTKDQVGEALNLASTAIDKLIFQGLVSKGESGLVEGRHYCKLHPEETNPSNFRFNLYHVLDDAWKSFKEYKND
jgi:hypothetical protein